jgi:hypothetical protein
MAKTEKSKGKRASDEVQEQHPTVYVIGGPNGAGKTTFATEFLPDFANCREFLNADLIAAGLSPFAPETPGCSSRTPASDHDQGTDRREGDLRF